MACSGEVFSKEVEEYIVNRIKDELAKRSIHVQIPNVVFNYEKGRIKFESTEFRTIPTLFKRITVGTFSTNIGFEVVETTNKDTGEIKEVMIGTFCIPVHAFYDHFDGGSNGFGLFDIRGETSLLPNASKPYEIYVC